MSNPFPPGGLNKHPGYRPPKRYVSDEQKQAYVDEWPDLTEHVDHGVWEHVSRCVYCVGCGQRLFEAR